MLAHIRDLITRISILDNRGPIRERLETLKLCKVIRHLELGGMFIASRYRPYFLDTIGTIFGIEHFTFTLAEDVDIPPEKCDESYGMRLTPDSTPPASDAETDSGEPGKDSWGAYRRRREREHACLDVYENGEYYVAGRFRRLNDHPIVADRKDCNSEYKIAREMAHLMQQKEHAPIEAIRRLWDIYSDERQRIWYWYLGHGYDIL